MRQNLLPTETNSADLDSATWKRTEFQQGTLYHVLLWLFIGVGLVVMVGPGIWMLLSSFKTRAEIMAVPMRLFPDKWMIENYLNAIRVTKFNQVFLNSIIITTAITIINVFTCTWGGYVFGKMKWRGRDFVFYLLLATMMIPGFLIIIPRYVLVAKLGMLNSYPSSLKRLGFS